MNAKLLAYHKIKALPLPPPKGTTGAIRRVFDNSQIIEKFDKWLMICGKAQNTRGNYTLAAKQFAKFLLDKPLTATTKDDVSAFVMHLYMKKFAATTIQVRLDALRVLFDCLQLGGQVRVSVPRFILRRKIPKHLPQVMSEEQINKLIAAARSPRDLAILELGYGSGLRVSELAHLRVEDVNVRAGSLTVRQGKGGDDRIALFGRPAAMALRDYVGNRTTGRLLRLEQISPSLPSSTLSGISRSETSCDGDSRTFCAVLRSRLSSLTCSSRSSMSFAGSAFGASFDQIGSDTLTALARSEPAVDVDAFQARRGSLQSNFRCRKGRSGFSHLGGSTLARGREPATF